MKRGSSGLNLVAGVDKPEGITSHDVVSRCRRIFQEKRVGHAGTLDPLATGVLTILVGSAARLSNYLTGHDKGYIAQITFGRSTTTCDSLGETIRESYVPDEIFDPIFASGFISGLVGSHMQLPPAYSAIKVSGKKACDEARKGNIIEMQPRPISIYSAELLGINGAMGDEPASWLVSFDVSKGTYIRSIARDIGNAVGCPAHISALRRIKSGNLSIDECVTLETLEEVGSEACLDPVRLLGYKFARANSEMLAKIKNGCKLAASEIELFEYSQAIKRNACACTSGVCSYSGDMENGSHVSIVCEGKLYAIYTYEKSESSYKPECVFPDGVQRGLC